MDLSFLKGTRIVVVDLETTSASTKTAFVREFGAAEFVDGKLVRGNSSLFSGGVCEAGAERVHGISDQSVVGKPTFASKAQSVASFLNGSILMGHNVLNFDLAIVKRSLYEQKIQMAGTKGDGKFQVIDTLLDARKYLKAPSNKLEDLCLMFGIEHGKHRAYGDCLSSWNLFLKIVEVTGNSNLNDYIRLG
jgi:DNA polymerase-3 subunit epsilon